MSGLAIIIPAYKPEYLRECLGSIADQSCKDFTVYVGDDASPFELDFIVAEFAEKVDIRYHRFEENVGGSDLVAHWERCLSLADGERWIWLFSDDDIMGPECVRTFYECEDKEEYDVLHYNISIIDGKGNIVRECASFPGIMTSAQFYSELYLHRIDARMPEFVFRKEALLNNGFVKFDLAWRTDNATVMKCAAETGILTISGERSKVYWRVGDSNISVRPNLRERKNEATINFFNWVFDFFDGKWMIPMIYQLKCILFEFVYFDRHSFMSDCRKGRQRLKYVRPWNALIWDILTLYRIYYRRYDISK